MTMVNQIPLPQRPAANFTLQPNIQLGITDCPYRTIAATFRGIQ
jgi:hypothetical protein